MKKISRNLKREINQAAHAAGVAHAKKVKASLMAEANHRLDNDESFNVKAFAQFSYSCQYGSRCSPMSVKNNHC